MDRLRRLPRKIGYFWAPRIASAIRKRWILLRHPHATIKFGEGCYLGPGFNLHIPDGGTFICGAKVVFRRNFRAEIQGEGKVMIGGGSIFTYDVLIQCSTSIEIGERCNIGLTTIVDGNHKFRDPNLPLLEQGYDFRPVTIADDVAITHHTTVTNNIGAHSFIGANSVVSKPIPAYTLAVGAPARAIEYFGPEDQRPAELNAR